MRDSSTLKPSIGELQNVSWNNFLNCERTLFSLPGVASIWKTHWSESIIKINLHFPLEIFAKIHFQLLPTVDFFVPLPKYRTNKFK